MPTKLFLTFIVFLCCFSNLYAQRVKSHHIDIEKLKKPLYTEFETYNTKWRVYDSVTKSVELISGNINELSSLPFEILNPESGEKYYFRRIADYAFEYQGSNHHIIIPEGVESLGFNSFAACADLVSVMLPASLLEIDSQAFANCYRLEKIEIPESVTTLKSSIFSNCFSLKEVIIKEGIKSISSCMFDNCTALKSVIFPKTIEYVESGAFFNCKNLTSIHINSAIRFQRDAFKDCSNIFYVILNTLNADLLENISFDDQVFNQANLYVFPEVMAKIAELSPFNKFERIKSINEYSEKSLVELFPEDQNPNIFNIPEGDLKHYVSSISEDYFCSIVFTNDNTVYIRNLLPSLGIPGAWIKATLEPNENCIYIPSGSYLDLSRSIYNDVEISNFDTRIYPISCDSNKDFIDINEANIILKINSDGTITLKNEGLGKGIGKAQRLNFYDIYHPTYHLVLTPTDISGLFPTNTDLRLDYSINQSSYNGQQNIQRDVQVIIDYPNVYIRGIVPAFPNMCIKGNFENNKITFPKNIMMGILDTGYPITIASASEINFNIESGNTFNYFSLETIDYSEDFSLNYDPITGDLISDKCLILDGFQNWFLYSCYDKNSHWPYTKNSAYPNNWYYQPKFINKSGYVLQENSIDKICDEVTQTPQIYNLLGNKVNFTNLCNGIYIYNGKKIIR